MSYWLVHSDIQFHSFISINYVVDSEPVKSRSQFSCAIRSVTYVALQTHPRCDKWQTELSDTLRQTTVLSRTSTSTSRNGGKVFIVE